MFSTKDIIKMMGPNTASYIQMGRKAIFNVVVCMLIVTCGCARERQAVPETATKAESLFVYEERIGIAVLQLEKTDGCLAVYNPSINPGAKVTLVDQPDAMQSTQSPAVNEASVVERLSEECGAHIATVSRSGSAPTFYRIQGATVWQGNRNVFAILDPVSPIVLHEGMVEGDLDGDGATESFRICSSSEGVHYQVWTGAPLQGLPRWHWYVYAGYDTEPSCTDKEYFGPKEQ